MQLAERLFQSFAPLNEKDFLPFSVPIFGNLRSVDVCSLYEVLREFFLNKLRKFMKMRLFFRGSRPFKRHNAVMLAILPPWCVGGGFKKLGSVNVVHVCCR